MVAYKTESKQSGPSSLFQHRGSPLPFKQTRLIMQQLLMGKSLVCCLRTKALGPHVSLTVCCIAKWDFSGPICCNITALKIVSKFTTRFDSETWHFVHKVRLILCVRCVLHNKHNFYSSVHHSATTPSKGNTKCSLRGIDRIVTYASRRFILFFNG